LLTAIKKSNVRGFLEIFTKILRSNVVRIGDVFFTKNFKLDLFNRAVNKVSEREKNI
jgi:hypothetical protein